MRGKKCEFCGEPISKDDIFCKGCGAKVNKKEVIKDAVIEGEKNSFNNTNFIMGIIVIILILMVLLGLFFIIK